MHVWPTPSTCRCRPSRRTGTSKARIIIALHELFDKVAEHAEEHVDAMAVGLAQFGKAARAAIEIADDLDDEVTADLFNEITASTDKDLWFVEAHLQADE